MQEFSSTVLRPDPRTRRTGITVLVATHRSSLGRARDRLEAALREECDDGCAVDLRTLPSFSASESTTTLLERLATADCLVLEHATSEMPVTDLAAILEHVRDRYSSLPVIVVTDASTDDETTSVNDAVQAHRLTDRLRIGAVLAADSGTDAGAPQPDRGSERLARRIRSLVDRRQLSALSTRLLAGLQLSQDAIAVAGPDGRLEAANCWFAAEFGYDRETLRGRSWTEFFTADAVARLETTAIPTAADGWRWTGTCTGRRRSGEPIPVRVRLAGLEDGSLVFAVEAADADDGKTTADEADATDSKTRRCPR